ncbi:chymotrypsin-like protease CTRL-1 [Montipora capricornis]|uniref:chymotrypsin-like protease CTRL-1 n=1 Tax=Montipora capricornis TaxID=246305 RepID=UPI0035F14B15
MKLLLFTFFIVALGNLSNGFYCNFDRNQCGFVQRKDDTFNWTRRRGSTSSGGTGPQKDVSGKGYYMYVEASRRKKGDKAKLEINPGLSGKVCISFFYSMRGGQNHMGILRVLINGEQAFFKSGRQGSNWLKALITCNKPVSSVIFEGTVGRGHQSDIAIDEVTIEACGGGDGGGGEDGGHATAPQPSTVAPPPIPQTPVPPVVGKCGIRPSTRIVGGVDSSAGDWPWQGMLTSSPNGPVFCGGSLVARQWLVTASHCVKRVSAASIYVRLGAYKRRETLGVEQDFTVSKIIMHPFYHKPISMSHDIALLKLDRPATLTKFVNLVCLPESIPPPTEGKKCWITGWGRSHSIGGSSPNILQQASVPIVGRNRCEWSYLGRIHDSMICAGLDRGGIDSCQGDSGGPMVCETGAIYYLQGVTSWGQGCARPNKYGVYARVKYVLKWLNEEMNKN